MALLSPFVLPRKQDFPSWLLTSLIFWEPSLLGGNRTQLGAACTPSSLGLGNAVFIHTLVFSKYLPFGSQIGMFKDRLASETPRVSPAGLCSDLKRCFPFRRSR